MAEKDKKVTFELKDLTYEELLNSYDEVTSFLSFLEESQVAVKGKGLGKNAMTDENLDEIIEDEENSEEAPAAEKPAQTETKPTPSVPEPVKASPPQPAPKEEIDTLFDSNDVDADDDDNQLPKMKGAS